MYRGPLVRKRPRKRNRDGTWRKKRSDAGKKREKTMSNNARDTQFEMFANALVRDLRETTSQEEAKLLLARHAYDLVKHTCEAISNSQVALYPDEMIKVVPDMDELPKEQEQ